MIREDFASPDEYFDQVSKSTGIDAIDVRLVMKMFGLSPVEAKNALDKWVKMRRKSPMHESIRSRINTLAEGILISEDEKEDLVKKATKYIKKRIAEGEDEPNPGEVRSFIQSEDDGLTADQAIELASAAIRAYRSYISSVKKEKLNKLNKLTESVLKKPIEEMKARVEEAMDPRETLMKKYAKMCGYDYPPFTWKPSDYTAAGWQKLIDQAKKESAPEDPAPSMKKSKSNPARMTNDPNDWEEAATSKVQAVFKMIKKNDLLDDRREYDVDDLYSAYPELSPEEAKQLYQLIQKSASESVHKEDIVSDVMKWEAGEMSAQEELQFFSKLVKSGQAWSLQGMYGRQAQALIDAGYLDKSGKILKKAESLKESEPSAGSMTFAQLTGHKNELGLVLLGAGGSASEWADGIAKMLKDEGIVDEKVPRVFKLVSKLSDNIKGSGGRTDLVLLFDSSAHPNVGKLAMWRLRFGDASWVDDFLDNHHKDYKSGDSHKPAFEDDDDAEDESYSEKVKKMHESATDVSEDEFRRYVRVQMSGRTNMFDVRNVQALSGLGKDVIMAIMKQYGELAKKYPSVKTEHFEEPSKLHGRIKDLHEHVCGKTSPNEKGVLQVESSTQKWDAKEEATRLLRALDDYERNVPFTAFSLVEDDFISLKEKLVKVKQNPEKYVDDDDE